jgi:hypothetical protein
LLEVDAGVDVVHAQNEVGIVELQLLNEAIFMLDPVVVVSPSAVAA